MGSHTAPFLGPDLEEIMANSRDQKELVWAWQGWRDAVGRQLRPIYERYVILSNKAAQLNGEQLGPVPAKHPGRDKAESAEAQRGSPPALELGFPNIGRAPNVCWVLKKFRSHAGDDRQMALVGLRSCGEAIVVSRHSPLVPLGIVSQRK